MEFLSEYLALTASLSAFSGALEIGVAANFGYSALFKLGSFSGASIDRWAKDEHDRVIGAMAEAPTFNGTLFSTNLDGLRDRYRRLIYRVNCCAAVWAVLTGILGFIALSLVLPFYPNVSISGQFAIILGLIVFGAVPLGMMIACILHAGARIHMYWLQRQHNVVIQYTQPLPQIEETRRKLKQPRKKPTAPTGESQ